ncbi:MAG TPA: mechanosensitive ion channel domain-containing protein [Usitatibacter sp.]|nr:mechanosensitive ion channel domain-containing protein [Usitatibacter sp.]
MFFDFDLSPIKRSIDAVIEASTPGDLVVQAALAAAGIGLAWMVARAVCARVPANPRWKFGRGDFERVAFPLLSLLFVWLAKTVISAFQDTDTGPMEVVLSLLLAFTVIRAASYILGHVLPEGGFQRAIIRAVVFVAWLLVILHLIGLLPEVLSSLDAHGVVVGKNKQEVTLLDVMRAFAALFIAITLALWISSVTETRMMAAKSVQATTRVVVGKVVRITTILVAIFVALPFAGIDVTTLSIFSGALGVGLGFGLQKVASNYVSGFIVLLDRSLRIGDVVTVDGRRGEVTAIESRYTVIKGADGVESIIPNELLITQSVSHHTYSDPKVSMVIPVTVAYESDIQRACDLLAQIAGGHKRVIAQPPSVARVKQLGPNGVDLELTVWISDPSVGEGDLRSDILKEVVQGYREAGITLPYARRDVRVIATPETPETSAKSVA